MGKVRPEDMGLDQVLHLDVLEFLGRIQSNSVSMVYGDPDYGCPIWKGKTTTRDCDWVADSYHSDAYIDWCESWVKEIARVLRPGGSCVIWGNREMTVLPVFVRYLSLKDILYWLKDNPHPMSSAKRFNSNVEVAVWCTKKGAPYTWRYRPGVDDNSNYRITHQTPGRLRFGHPTAKHPDLVKWHIERLTNPGDTVVSLFSGSGSTEVACIELGRHVVGCDYDQKWVDVANHRIEQELAKTRGVRSTEEDTE